MHKFDKLVQWNMLSNKSCSVFMCVYFVQISLYFLVFFLLQIFCQSSTPSVTLLVCSKQKWKTTFNKKKKKILKQACLYFQNTSTMQWFYKSLTLNFSDNSKTHLGSGLSLVPGSFFSKSAFLMIILSRCSRTFTHCSWVPVSNHSQRSFDSARFF